MAVTETRKKHTLEVVFSNKINGIFASHGAFCLLVAMAGLWFLTGIANASTVVNTDPIPAPPRITLSDSTSIIPPTLRPDPALALTIAPPSMVLPAPRPDRRSLYPLTPLTLRDGYFNTTGTLPEAKDQSLKLKAGEGLTQLLSRSGLDYASTKSAVTKIRRHISNAALRSLPVGFEVLFLPMDENQVAALQIAVENDLDLTLIKTDEGWDEQLSLRPVERYLTFVKGTIDVSLYDAAKKAGMEDSVFNTFIRVLAFSVDFQREIRKGDQFEALVEIRKDSITGETIGQPELYFLSMILSGRKIEFFRHKHYDGTVGWYDESGNSAARTLMRTPVNGARLSSGYGNRRHPVLGYSRVHRGVDFAAPIGTPIMAAGSGVIEFAGWNGNYGKYIRIRHNGAYKTAYAHLSRVNTGITSGTRVAQGQIIGFIGNTGLSTGPHLHYEILVNDRKVNPMKVALPVGTPIPEDERPYFDVTMRTINSELAARGILRFAEDLSFSQ